jgi:hypothetical protein
VSINAAPSCGTDGADLRHFAHCALDVCGPQDADKVEASKRQTGRGFTRISVSGRDADLRGFHYWDGTRISADFSIVDGTRINADSFLGRDAD